MTTPGEGWARTTRGTFSLAHAVPAPVDERRSGRYVLLLTPMPADGGQTLSCGALRPP